MGGDGGGGETKPEGVIPLEESTNFGRPMVDLSTLRRTRVGRTAAGEEAGGEANGRTGGTIRAPGSANGSSRP